MIRKNYFFDDYEILNSFFTESKSDSIKTKQKKLENSYELSLYLPSLNKEDISIEVEDDMLIVKSEKETDFISNFEKSYFISDKLNKEKITSKLENGILSIKIPYREKRKKLISVQ